MLADNSNINQWNQKLYTQLRGRFLHIRMQVTTDKRTLLYSKIWRNAARTTTAYSRSWRHACSHLESAKSSTTATAKGVDLSGLLMRPEHSEAKTKAETETRLVNSVRTGTKVKHIGMLLSSIIYLK